MNSRKRQTRAAVTLALLALCAWWRWPAAPEVVAVVRAPVVEADKACVGPDEGGEPDAVVVDGSMPGFEFLPPPPPLSRVACPMPEDVLALHATGTVRLDGKGDSQFELARFEGDAMLVSAIDGLYGGTLYLDGFSPVKLTVVDGRCTVAPFFARAGISGVIVPTAGALEDQVSIQGCGANVRVDQYGSFFAEVDPGPCTLFAVRLDGTVSVRSDPLDLDPLPGEDLAVELVLPDWQAASVGMALKQDEDGDVVIGAVGDDSPAARAQLLPGDVILAVDGDDVQDLSMWEVMDRVVGPEGTDVVYEVARDGKAVSVVITREIED